MVPTMPPGIWCWIDSTSYSAYWLTRKPAALPAFSKCADTGANSEVSRLCVWPISSTLRAITSTEGTDGPLAIGRTAVWMIDTPSSMASR